MNAQSIFWLLVAVIAIYFLVQQWRKLSKRLATHSPLERGTEGVCLINNGARKALDPDSPEHKEIIDNNREAFTKLSKL